MRRPTAFLVAATALAATGCSQQQPAPPVTAAPAAASTAAAPRVEPSPTVRDAQQRLHTLGYYDGPADGLVGPGTRQAVEQFQRDRGLAASGDLTATTTAALRDEAVPSRRAAAAPASSRVAELSDPTAVRTVQNRMRQLGFYDGPADGVWGAGTQQALERYQRSRGLERVGEPTEATLTSMGIDPASLPTRAASATEPLEPGVVRGIQRRLRQGGFYAGPVDGVWGANSQAAVERFQRNRGLQPSGDLNPATLAALGLDPNNLSGSSTPPPPRRSSALR
jgi:peptidoglycan hydrolase-like protein with peptidoglycan-binding domain